MADESMAYSVGIEAELDTAQFETGTRKVRKDMRDIDTSTKRTDKTISSFSSNLTSGLKKVGVYAGIGAGILAGLGMASSTIAPLLGDMKVATFDLGESMGQILEPIMKSVVEGLQNMVNWVGENSEFFTQLATDVSGVVTGAFAGLKDIWDKIVSTTKTLKVDFFLGGLLEGLALPAVFITLAKLAKMSNIGALAVGGTAAMINEFGKPESDWGSRLGFTGAMVGGIGGSILGGPLGLLAGTAIVGGAGSLIGGAIDTWLNTRNQVTQQTTQSQPMNIQNHFQVDGRETAFSLQKYFVNNISYSPGAGR